MSREQRPPGTAGSGVAAISAFAPAGAHRHSLPVVNAAGGKGVRNLRQIIPVGRAFLVSRGKRKSYQKPWRSPFVAQKGVRSKTELSCAGRVKGWHEFRNAVVTSSV